MVGRGVEVRRSNSAPPSHIEVPVVRGRPASVGMQLVAGTQAITRPGAPPSDSPTPGSYPRYGIVLLISYLLHQYTLNTL